MNDYACISALEGVDGQHHNPGSFISRNDLVPIAQEARLALEPVWMGTKDLAPLGFDSWTDQPMASNYT